MSVLSASELQNAPSTDPRPHVVILGAGASRAACPQGDATGKLVPLISNSHFGGIVAADGGSAA